MPVLPTIRRLVLLICYLIIAILLLRWFEPAVAQPQCILKSGLTRARCQNMATIGCPVRFLGTGCKVKKKAQGDGGCQPRNECPFCCQASCKKARKFDNRCMWNVDTKSCFKCPLVGVVDNGVPSAPSSPVIVPSDWTTDGLGDGFTVYSNCNGNGQFITGIVVYLAETSLARIDDPLTGTLDSRVVIFHSELEERVAEWSGTCNSEAYDSGGPYYENAPRLRKVTCDFSSAGVIDYPAQCQYPALPQGNYDLLFQHMGPNTLGWAQSMPNTGCNKKPCAFAQQMASAVGPRYDICSTGPRLHNLAFQILGTNVAPPIAGC